MLTGSSQGPRTKPFPYSNLSPQSCTLYDMWTIPHLIMGEAEVQTDSVSSPRSDLKVCALNHYAPLLEGETQKL